MELFVQGIQLWYHDPLVSIPVLKLFSELVQNRSQRLLFDVTSPNGVLLFREASKIIVTYGDRILSLTDIPEAELYRRKYPYSFLIHFIFAQSNWEEFICAFAKLPLKCGVCIG